MSEKKAKQFVPMDVIALPPLKMALMHIKEERINKNIESSVVPNLQTQAEVADEDALKKIIEHLEQKKKK